MLRKFSGKLNLRMEKPGEMRTGSLARREHVHLSLCRETAGGFYIADRRHILTKYSILLYRIQCRSQKKETFRPNVRGIIAVISNSGFVIE